MSDNIIKRKLDASGLVKRHYHQQTVTVTLDAVTQSKSKEGDPKVWARDRYTLITDNPITATDGYVLNKGSKLFFDVYWKADEESQARANRDSAAIALALRGMKPGSVLEVDSVSEEDIGKQCVAFLTYQPGKDDPTDASKGFDNFRFSPLDTTTAPTEGGDPR